MTTANNHEALDTATWFDRMDRFAAGLGEARSAPDRHIRKAYHLHCLAPHPLKGMMPPPVDEARMEAMLERGALESAVASLTGTAGQAALRNGAAAAAVEGDMSVDSTRMSETAVTEATPMAMLEAWAAGFLRLRSRPH